MCRIYILVLLNFASGTKSQPDSWFYFGTSNSAIISCQKSLLLFCILYCFISFSFYLFFFLIFIPHFYHKNIPKINRYIQKLRQKRNLLKSNSLSHYSVVLPFSVSFFFFFLFLYFRFIYFFIFALSICHFNFSFFSVFFL